MFQKNEENLFIRKNKFHKIVKQILIPQKSVIRKDKFRKIKEKFRKNFFPYGKEK